MFGLLKQIRDKSDSDVGDIEKKIQSELEQITQYQQQQQQQQQQQHHHHATNGGSPGSGSAGLINPTPPIVSRAQQRMENSTQAQHVSQRVAQRIARDRHLTSDSDGENARFYMRQYEQYRQQQQQQQQPPSSGSNIHTFQQLQNKHQQQEQALAQQQQQDLDHKGYKKQRYIPMYSDSDEERKFLSRDRLVDSSDMQARYLFSHHAHDNKIRHGGDVPMTATTSQAKKIEAMQDDKNNVEEGTIQTAILKSGKTANNRIKLRAFKLRTRTDKSLYQHFAKKVVRQREVQAQQIKDENMHNFIMKKQAMLQALEDSVVAQINPELTPGAPQSQQQENPESNNDLEDIDHALNDDHYNNNNNNDNTICQQASVVTRMEMDMPVSYEEMSQQQDCYYCHYRPLHTFNLHTNKAMTHTTESGEHHLSTLKATAGPRVMKEMNKGGVFIENIEMVLFALKFNFFLQPYQADHVVVEQTDCVYLKNVESIVEYVEFCHKNRITLPQCGSTFPLPPQQLATRDDILPQKVVVQLSCDWFQIIQRQQEKQQQHNDNNNNTLIPTHTGLHLKLKDEYAKNIVHYLALYHSCYATPTLLPAAVVAEGKYQYNVEIVFNNGSCLCLKQHNINNIQQVGAEKVRAQQEKQEKKNDNNDNDDEEEEEEDVIGDIMDCYGVKVEQFTYCIPHIVPIAKALAKKQQEHSD